MTIALPAGSGAAQVTRYADHGDWFEFVVDADERICLRVHPQRFPIAAGKDYSINTSYFDPFVVHSEMDGELSVWLDRPCNCTVVLDGRPQALYGFTANYPMNEWPHTSAHADFLQAGVQLHWVPLESTGTQSRYGGVLGYDPTAFISLYVSLEPYHEFCDVHPEAAWVNARGQKSLGEKAAP